LYVIVAVQMKGLIYTIEHIKDLEMKGSAQTSFLYAESVTTKFIRNKNQVCNFGKQRLKLLGEKDD